MLRAKLLDRRDHRSATRLQRRDLDAPPVALGSTCPHPAYQPHSSILLSATIVASDQT
jgi:hypothetical protein